MMDVRNRLADVVKLRCNACQNFFEMIIKDDWKEILYNKATKEVTGNTRYRNNYISVYEKMRDIGVENYQIQEMDVTLICQLINYDKELLKYPDISNNTLNQLFIVKEDRNLTNHSGENEDEKELYLRGLLSLCNLKNLIRTIDKNETYISDEKRLEYRQKYNKEIEELKDILDEERIELIQIVKEIDKELENVLKQKDSFKAWVDLKGIYLKKYLTLESDPKKFSLFSIRSSYAGLEFAHLDAAFDCAYLKDYDEMVKHLRLYINAQELTEKRVKEVLSVINQLKKLEKQQNQSILSIIKELKGKGYDIYLTDEGNYQLKEDKYEDRI